MKRLVLTVTGTVAGLAALLSFKVHAHPLTSAGALPAATAPVTVTSTATSTSTGKRKSTGKSTATATAASYTGPAITTRYGIVQVKVSVAGHKITDVAFVQLTAYDPHSQQINSYAGPQLLQETLTNQTAQVDTVSGASYTSEGYRESLQAALDQAGLK